MTAAFDTHNDRDENRSRNVRKRQNFDAMLAQWRYALIANRY